MTPERQYTVFWTGEYHLTLTHVRRRGAVVLSLYRNDHLVCSGEVGLIQLVVESRVKFQELREGVRAYAQMNRVKLSKGWAHHSRDGNPDNPDKDWAA